MLFPALVVQVVAQHWLQTSLVAHSFSGHGKLEKAAFLYMQTLKRTRAAWQGIVGETATALIAPLTVISQSALDGVQGAPLHLCTSWGWSSTSSQTDTCLQHPHWLSLVCGRGPGQLEDQTAGVQGQA